MVTTVTLSRGAMRMARAQVVVKRLAAIHDLGAMDVLCTDKTGTLTEARIALVGHPGPDGADSPRVLELAAVNSRPRERRPQRARRRHPRRAPVRRTARAGAARGRALRFRAPPRRPCWPRGTAGGCWWSRARRRTCSPAARRWMPAATAVPLDAAAPRSRRGDAARSAPPRGCACSPSPGARCPPTARRRRAGGRARPGLRRLLRLRRSAEGSRRRRRSRGWRRAACG